MNTEKATGQSRIFAWLRLARLAGWTGQFWRQRSETTLPLSGTCHLSTPSLLADPEPYFTAAERGLLLHLARESLMRALNREDGPSLGQLPSKLMETKACFVTLAKRGKLRGCVGHIFPKEALASAVINNTRNAAFWDPRFPAVAPSELDEIRIEISVLSEMDALCFSSPEELLEQLHPYRDGVLLQLGSGLATFLPQVWNQFGGKTEFLDRLSEKAGYPRSAWREAGTLVSTYQSETFGETLEGTSRN